MSKHKTSPTDQPRQPNPNRERLKEFSAGLQLLVKMGVYDCVNEALIDIHYRRDGHTTFNTFHQWLELGKCVKKGEKGFVVWSSPKQAKRKGAAEQPSEDGSDEYKLFGICYLFSNLQVDDLPPKK